MARRQGYVAEFSKRYPEVPHLHVDAGHLFSDRAEAGDSHLSEDVVLGNQWVVRAFDKMQLAASNISARDIPQLQVAFTSDQYKKLAEEYPFTHAMISANIRATSGRYVPPAPYLVKSMNGPRLPRPLRVGITGLTERGNTRTKWEGYSVEDPRAAAKRIIPKLRAQCDFLVLLAYMGPATADLIAKENPGIDQILLANVFPYASPETKIGKTSVLQCINEGKSLGELRIYVDQTGAIKETKSRTISLNEIIPDDPATAELRAQARKELSVVQERIARSQARENNPANSLIAGEDAARASGRGAFVTAGGCQSCHDREYQIWQGSGHAHAFATLQRVKRENEADCISCHVTGYKQAGGFANIYSTPRLKDVQCEACHTQGSFHSTNPVLPYGKVSMPAGCVTCHTQENSPDFKLLEYWTKIKH